MKNPVSGPVPLEEFRKLASLPHGQAKNEIRKHDPLWGIAPGEKIEFVVRCTGRMRGKAYVKASSQEEADALADKLTCGQIDWNDGDDNFDVESVDPLPPRKVLR